MTTEIPVALATSGIGEGSTNGTVMFVDGDAADGTPDGSDRILSLVDAVAQVHARLA